MFLTKDPSNWPFILSAGIITFIALGMLWKLTLHKYTFRIENFRKKWPNCNMSWDNFWNRVPCGTVLKVRPGKDIGRINYQFTMECGYTSLDGVPLADCPSNLQTGVYKKKWNQKIVHVTEM